MTQNPLVIALILSATFLLLFAIERFAPLRAPRGGLVRRLLVNLCISALAIGTAYFVVAPTARAALQRVAIDRLGLLQWVELPEALELMIGFALLDLSFYYWHVANHKIPFLWRFHNVHHIDPDLDISTAFRFHFGEVALSSGLRVLQIVLLGVSPLTFASYELVFQINTLLQHSNIRLPLAVESLLNVVLVTPRMHGVHHSHVRREDNSNYSVVFSWWDRVHRTLLLNIPQSRIVIGIPAYLEPGNNRVRSVLMLPFRSQRDYWRTADGRTVERTELETGIPPWIMVA